MTGLPSTMVVEPEKIATLSYHLSFQIETGRRAHLTKSRDTQWPQPCARVPGASSDSASSGFARAGGIGVAPLGSLMAQVWSERWKTYCVAVCALHRSLPGPHGPCAAPSSGDQRHGQQRGSEWVAGRGAKEGAHVLAGGGVAQADRMGAGSKGREGDGAQHVVALAQAGVCRADDDGGGRGGAEDAGRKFY